MDARERGQPVVVQLADGEHLAEPAAMAARAAGVGEIALFQDQHGRARLEQLDRRVAGGRGPEQAGLAVAARARALTATHEQVVGIDAPAGVRP